MTETFTPEQQYEHREMLAAALAGGWTPMRFNMKMFCFRGDPVSRPLDYEYFGPNDHECGTSGCVLGHGVAATGVNPIPVEDEGFEGWHRYSIRVFGVIYNSLKGSFLYDSQWPNDPMKAADRIAWINDGHFTERQQIPTDTPRPWDGYFLRSGRTPGGWYGLKETNKCTQSA